MLRFLTQVDYNNTKYVYNHMTVFVSYFLKQGNRDGERERKNEGKTKERKKRREDVKVTFERMRSQGVRCGKRMLPVFEYPRMMMLL